MTLRASTVPDEELLQSIVSVVEGARQAGAIGEYAIGGSIAVIFHTEPFFTEDLDVFTILPERRGGIVTLGPLYAHLMERGYTLKGEHVIIGGFPVQFLPPGDKLETEAVERAEPFQIGPYRTRVMRPEYLLAIYTRLRRPKDWPKIDLLVRREKMDKDLFEDLLQRHGLDRDWKKVQTFLDECSRRS